MYSEELLKTLQDNNYNIDNETYFNNFNPINSPQIDYMEITDKENGEIRLHTRDNYDLKFKVYVKKR